MQIVQRRAEYIAWIAENFSALEPDMDPRDGRHWALNHVRLTLNRDTEQASHYFESFQQTADNDINFIRALRTLLVFRDSPRLSDKAKQHLNGLLTSWPKRDLSTVARWPAIHTENHDLMHLTIRMFAEQQLGNDVSRHVREICKSIAWRFERGWVEWNSPCYQFHYSNPLIILIDHGPTEELKRAARDLLNLLLAERLVLGVNGYLGGPAFRCRTADANHSPTARKVAYLEDNRYDGFVPSMWIAFGLGEPRFDFAKARVSGLEPATVFYASGNEPRLKQDEGLFLACSSFQPHPILLALAEEARTRKHLVYSGRRHLGWPAEDLWATQRWMPGALYYYNTPHISMGSLHSSGYCCQSRYCNIMFAANPSQNLRVEIILPDVRPHKRRHEARGRLVQHKNWLLGQGTLFEDGGVTGHRVGAWNVYTVGKGLCAHMELPDSYHALQVSDLDTFPGEDAFVQALSTPEMTDGKVHGRTMDGDSIAVSLSDMSIAVNGTPRPHPPTMLHDSECMTSEHGSGRITITTKAGSLTLDRHAFYDGPTDTPAPRRSPGRPVVTVDATPPATPAWGNTTNVGRITTTNHVRALGGTLRTDADVRLTSVSVLLPKPTTGSIRLAVYSGGDLKLGPHAGSAARLLCDLGKTAPSASGWVTLTVPEDDVSIAAGSVVWIAWKGKGGSVPLLYQEAPVQGMDFQSERGRFESKAIGLDEDQPWPAQWPSDTQDAFEPYWYSCCLSYQVR